MRRRVTRQSVLTPELSCTPCLCPPASQHHHACAASQRACRCTRAERWALRAWMWSTATSEKWGRVSYQPSNCVHLLCMLVPADVASEGGMEST